MAFNLENSRNYPEGFDITEPTINSRESSSSNEINKNFHRNDQSESSLIPKYKNKRREVAGLLQTQDEKNESGTNVLPSSLLPITIKQESLFDENDLSREDEEEEKEERVYAFGLNKKIFKRIRSLNDSSSSNADSVVECKICYKQIKESSMRQHFKTHTGVKPFRCSFCNARFTRKGDVVRHAKAVHRERKPFKCDLCAKRFSEKKGLITHLKNHARMLNYFSCSTCGFKFGKREYYESHVKFIHPLPEGESLSTFDMYEKSVTQLGKLLAEENSKGVIVDCSSTEIEESGERNCAPDNIKIEIKEEMENWNFSNENMVDEEQDPGSVPIVKSEVVFNEVSSLHEECEISDSEVTTDSDCTWSFTTPLSNENYHHRQEDEEEDEELVNKAILSAASQSANVIENMQFTSGSNMTSNQFRTKNCLKPNNPVIKVTKPPGLKYPEIHVTGNFGNNLYKFIIHIPQQGEIMDLNTREGLEKMVNIVNYVCEGKGPLRGSICIEVKQQST